MRVLLVFVSMSALSLVACSSSVIPGASATASAAATTATAAPFPLPTSGATLTPAAQSEAATAIAAPIKYVALGDSYTIGTSVKPRDRWPNQLVRTLNPAADLELVANLGVNGATTNDVIDNQLDELPAFDPGFISLLIGVNDVVRGEDLDKYRQNMRTIFQALLDIVPADRILLVSTPDYTLTPQGASYGDPTRQSARIHTFNEALAKEAAQQHLLLVDITPIAREVPGDPSLVASDGLHPSGKQYAGWVELIAQAVRPQLQAGYQP